MAAPRKYSLESRERAVRMYRASDPKPQIKKLAVDLGVAAHVHAFALQGRVDARRAVGKFSEITDMEWEEINQLIRFISIDLLRRKAVSSMRHQFANEVVDMALAGDF